MPSPVSRVLALGACAALLLTAPALIGCDTTRKPSPLGPYASDYMSVVRTARELTGQINSSLPRLQGSSELLARQKTWFQQAASELNAQADALEDRIQRQTNTTALPVDTRALYLRTQQISREWAGFLQSLEAGYR